MIYENQHYEVVIVEQKFTTMTTEYYSGYAVVNKDTEVLEYMHPSLPEVIHWAEAASQALETKAWEWRKRNDTDATRSH